ncbi:MAG: hypothetical protein BRC40_00175 [Cyanobacteria bacterium QH_8_48_120]|jgi:hypothetical protein|nr:MAG: hypothetical protein BRC34_02475 [Cyanobacteria bacterium QH_1_48_107]PSO61796.1 MAG: hypothetical protein BRC38_17370 [Cyanobacteria bacterium QH_6_48_35]PSO62185.1 MAG: hypothetical protein BRC39_06560 [Cyanobacteria bacterium QH_7_48_89]PSO78331.1 MAG: hypothetical protein BRC40_00175 [Cyanobacteria bacterium QH_8_48_120]PSO88555.1 MAG: hypothetical protein BRC41_02540 [Cyanobacteria bacterium QH_9_48_43]PSP09461.1 MAG: hypothetical protein BRC50_17500 [Cyanobacteria bacterium SW_11
MGGTANGLLNVAVRTLLHKRISVYMHGRAFAAYVALTNVAINAGFLAAGSFAANASRMVTLSQELWQQRQVC